MILNTYFIKIKKCLMNNKLLFSKNKYNFCNIYMVI